MPVGRTELATDGRAKRITHDDSLIDGLQMRRTVLESLAAMPTSRPDESGLSVRRASQLAGLIDLIASLYVP